MAQGKRSGQRPEQLAPAEELEVRCERQHYSKDRVLGGLFRRARAELEF
jgi:hypothetical protein